MPHRAAMTLAPFAAGISNQKIAIASLLLAGRAEHRPVILPPLVEFVAGGGELAQRSFAALLWLDDDGVQPAGRPAETRDPAAAFHDLMGSLRAACLEGELAQHPGIALLAGMRPARHLADRIAQGRERLRWAGVHICCQLRIEADWRTYVADRLSPRLLETQDLTLDPIHIIRKIGRTLDVRGPILVSCDAANLPFPLESLRRDIRRETGIDILFKTDLLNADATDGPLANSLIDFELMTETPVIVGTTLSSFFGLASLTRLGRQDVSGEAWAYNALGDRLQPRTDEGVFANVTRATEPDPTKRSGQVIDR